MEEQQIVKLPLSHNMPPSVIIISDSDSGSDDDLAAGEPLPFVNDSYSGDGSDLIVDDEIDESSEDDGSLNTLSTVEQGGDVISIVKSRSQNSFHEKSQVSSLSDCHVQRDSNGNFKPLVLLNKQIPGTKDGTSSDQGAKHPKSNKYHSKALLCKSSFVEKENLMPHGITNKEVTTEFQKKDGFSVQSKGYLTGTEMDMQSERSLKRRIQRSPAARTSSSSSSPGADSSKQQKICVAKCILRDRGQCFKGSSFTYLNIKDTQNTRNRQTKEDSAAANLETSCPLDEGLRDNSEISKLSNYFGPQTSSNVSNSSFSSNFSFERNMPKEERGSQRSHQFNVEQGHSDLQKGGSWVNFPIRDVRSEDHGKRWLFGSYGYYASPIVKDISPVCQKSLCPGHKLFSSGSSKLSSSFRSDRNFLFNVTNVGVLNTKQNPSLFNDQASSVVRSSPTITSPCHIPACAGTSLSLSSSFPSANHSFQEFLHHGGGYHPTRSVSSRQSSLLNPASESEASLGNYSIEQPIMPHHQETAESSADEPKYKNIILEERSPFDPSHIDLDPRCQTDLMRHKREVKTARMKYLSRNADSMDDRDTHNEPEAHDQFRSALILLVKEFLRPAWSEGKLGRDVYKSILRKSVDKVIRTQPPHQVPSTAVSIQQYLYTFRPKILKLVEEYIKLYTKSGAVCG